MMTGTYTPAPPVKREENYYYWVASANGKLLSHHDTFAEARDLANAAGCVIATKDEYGDLHLMGHDPLVKQVLGRVHIGESFRTALRRVISLWGGNEGKDYRDFEERRAPCPGWSKFRALDKPSRRVLMGWVAWIHRAHFRTYAQVMGGRL